jgi:hypothetical protein
MRLMQRPSKRPNTGPALRGILEGAARPKIPRTRTWLWGAACLFAGALLVTVADRGQQIPAGSPDRLIVQAGAPRPFDTSQQLQTEDQQQTKTSPEAANAERKKQLSDDSARLLKLANELKAEVDKTDKDTLSIAVIRKADEIEQLAHKVKEKIRLTTGSN